MVYEAGSIHCKKKWPPRGFKLADFLKFLKLGLTEMTSASGRRPRVRAVYPSLAPTMVVMMIRMIQGSSREGPRGESAGK